MPAFPETSRSTLVRPHPALSICNQSLLASRGSWAQNSGPRARGQSPTREFHLVAEHLLRTPMRSRSCATVTRRGADFNQRSCAPLALTQSGSTAMRRFMAFLNALFFRLSENGVPKWAAKRYPFELLRAQFAEHVACSAGGHLRSWPSSQRTVVTTMRGHFRQQRALLASGITRVFRCKSCRTPPPPRPHNLPWEPFLASFPERWAPTPKRPWPLLPRLGLPSSPQQKRRPPSTLGRSSCGIMLL